ncbi:saccharopine dehydrogenase family protein [Mycolicibacterium brisbanense]|uniref:Saccharopine dehydrogenase n=1 Tax=Mycolicibacterium brisbanense TaxID=146020 RepID=A0A100W1Y5_9MYCO|nr:saccharopine dehydrogenase NADP-binding domain-containing protein [Mycolicibacterium brisbanense]MCV7157510.1 saccharopine dehydrogenase NADP-binding domain-containing protein [Mycolicibacterium brisbanense]GAS90149.1 saccharopine dehydrogenase [Mycolicibacterium brisbanense]
MVSVGIAGLGQMGGAALRILLDHLPDAQFLAMDRSPEALRRAEALDPGRVRGQIVDVTTGTVDLDGLDLVLNMSGPFYAGSGSLAQAALRAGTTYIDIGDDLEATETVLAMDADAKRAGVALVSGAGWSPGVSNWCAARLLDEFPDSDGVQVVWATHERDPGGLAPLRHMLHMAVTPCPVWRDGQWVQSPGFVPETAATFTFPDPLGVIQAYDTAHPEPRTLARFFPRLRNASCKGSLRPDWANAAFSTLGRIGFGHDDVVVNIAGQDVEPAEFLWKMMWARHEASARPKNGKPLTALLIQVLNGPRVHGAVALIDDAPMSRGTGLGAAVAALSALRECPPPGAWGPEIFPWQFALTEFERIGRSLGGFGPGIQSLAAESAPLSAPAGV